MSNYCEECGGDCPYVSFMCSKDPQWESNYNTRNPLNVYYDICRQAEDLGATIMFSADHERIYEYNRRAHFAPFCTTSGPSDMRGNTPHLIILKEGASLDEQTRMIEAWIARELEYKRSRGY